MVYAGVGVCLVAAYFVLPLSRNVIAVLDVAFPLANVVAIVVGVRWHKPARLQPWVLFAFGMSFFFGQNAVRSFLIIFTAGPIGPAPLQDVFQSTGYVLVITALISLIYSRNGGARDRASLIDASIIIAGASMLAWVFMLAPFVYEGSVPISARLFKILYPVANVVLLAVSVRLAMSRGSHTPAFVLLLMAMMTSLVGNTLSLSAIEERGFLMPDNPINVFFFFAYIFAGAFPLHPSMRNLTDVGAVEGRITRTRMALFLGASTTGVAAYFIEQARGREVDVPVILVGSLAIFLLVLFRLAGLNKETKEAAEALRVSEQSARLLFESSPLPMWVFDTQTLDFLAVNDAAIGHYGYAREEFLAMKITDIRPQQDIPRLEKEMQTVRAASLTGTILNSGEWTHRLKDGRLITAEIISHSLDLFGRSATLVVAQDVTEKKRVEGEKKNLEGQLRQSQKLEAVGQLAGGVAHDFNNLLAVILNYGRFAKDELEPGTPPHDDVTQVLSAAEKAARLVKQLLAFSRREIVKPEIIDLNDVVEELHKLLTRTTKESIKIVVDLGEDLWRTNADPGQMEQVLLNLAVNADAAMPNGGTLAIRTSNKYLSEEVAAQKAELTPGNYVCISVSDDGIGMSEATAAHMFEPFFTTKGIGEGTGLGLSTVYGIVKQADGYIYAYSEEGRGTTFNIYLPATDAAVSEETEDSFPAMTETGTGTILVVEDEDGVRAVTERILKQAGYDVLVAGDPFTAIEMATEVGRIDLLLTDVIMPGLSGRELAHRLQSIRPGLRTIFMSGYTDQIIAQQGVLEDGASFLQKPFGADELLHIVRDVLSDAKHPRFPHVPDTTHP